MGVATGVGVGVGVGVATGIGDGVAVGVGLTTAIATPLFHTSRLPLFTQVYFLPAEVDTAPALLHAAPALTAACAPEAMSRKARTRTHKRFNCFIAPY